MSVQFGTKKSSKHENTKKERSSPKWCSCGWKRHGKNHDEGMHHTGKTR